MGNYGENTTSQVVHIEEMLLLFIFIQLFTVK